MIQSILYRILSLIQLPPWTPYESNDSTKGAQRKNVQYLKKTNRKHLYYPNNMP